MLLRTKLIFGTLTAGTIISAATTAFLVSKSPKTSIEELGRTNISISSPFLSTAATLDLNSTKEQNPFKTAKHENEEIVLEKLEISGENKRICTKIVKKNNEEEPIQEEGEQICSYFSWIKDQSGKEGIWLRSNEDKMREFLGNEGLDEINKLSSSNQEDSNNRSIGESSWETSKGEKIYICQKQIDSQQDNRIQVQCLPSTIKNNK
ncbi:hypothetical protein [Mycoplasma parvum]|uniref:Uncharacterized protein n=1 Tax=Mycoplasma parvum str. Indiana TaxID=1403316 RepID=U5NBI8_9MOLU|nr:hypothetical protein [Mycoplasma parvum]AGX88911.1 hypothetical protein PRV_00725 [Mycoplasma parvum str. Indiana]